MRHCAKSGVPNSRPMLLQWSLSAEIFSCAVTHPAGRRAAASGAAVSRDTLTLLRAGATATSLQRRVHALDQARCGEGLGQETNCSGRQRAGTDVLLRESRDENERRL